MDSQIAVSIKLINNTEETLVVWLQWVNSDQECSFDFNGNMICDHYIYVGELSVNGKKYQRDDYKWIGEPAVFNWTREGFGEIGLKYKVKWDNGIIHEFTITEDLIEVISKASEAEPWLRKRK